MQDDSLTRVARLRDAIAAMTAIIGKPVFALAALGCLLLGVALLPLIPSQTLSANEAASTARIHQGVASCAGSMCHGHSVADGKPIRGDEILRWQEESSPSGAHSRAYRVIREPRGQAIIRRMGLNDAGIRNQCLGCHASPGSGPQVRVNEGVDCETCHGPARGWLASHYTVGATHARNVSQGLTPLEDPKRRANICLDCHFGGEDAGQFVTHRIMAAGHPRVSFELDLFSTLQQHHDEDADYVVEADGVTPRKPRTNSVKFWAVGQALALDRSLRLFANDRFGNDGIFPQFYFYDCHSCHRRIYDGEDAAPGKLANPGRGNLPAGYPPFNDENMIMLSAAGQALQCGSAGSFNARSRAFHEAMTQGRAAATRAGEALRASANDLADCFSNASFGREQSFAIMDVIASNAISERFTDYEGAVQSVMAIDTLLNGLVNSGQVSTGAAQGLRIQINQAYAAVNEPNGFQPLAFRRALGGAIRSIRALR